MAEQTADRHDLAKDLAAALAEPAFASLARAGAPVVVAEGDPGQGVPAQVVHASASALALFAVADRDELSRRLFASDEPGAQRLAHLARVILPGAAARLERLSLRFDSLPETVTFLCRRTPGEKPLFVLAGLGLRAGQGRKRPSAQVSPADNSPAHSSNAQGTRADTHSLSQGSAFGVASVTKVSTPAPAENSDGLDALRADLQHRYPGLPPARFLWRSDAGNIVTEVTPPLAEIVGPGCANIVGRDLVEAATALGLDRHGKLAAALLGRATFSGVELDWPIDHAAAAAPVTLGALPAFDRDRGFEGWRGFGVIHLDRLHPAAPSVGLPLLGQPPLQPPHLEPTPAEKDDAPAPPVIAPFSGVVVPLRPLAQMRPSAPAETGDGRRETGDGRREDAAGQPGAREGEDEKALVTLAPHERNAFREIARTLGARKDAVPTEASREGADGKQAEIGALRSGETAPDAKLVDANLLDANLLDALPIGLLVAHGDSAVFANRLLLDWLGFVDVAALEKAGGLRAACTSGMLEFAPSERRTLLLRSASGESFAVDARSAKTLWQDAPAEFYALLRPSTAALEKRIGVLEAGLRQRESEADETLDILDTASDGFVLVNAEGAVLGMNRAAETLFGANRAEMSGKDFLSLLAPESHATAQAFFTQAKANDQKGGCEALGRPRQGGAMGGLIPLHLTFGRLGKPQNGKFCLVLRDLSQWKQAEGAMRQARVQAERDNQAKSEFLAKVSHEIRTPLNAILGFAEVIMDERFGPVGNARYKDYLKDIHASGSHVMSLVNDLLDLEKIESGNQELTFTAVDVNRIVAECVSLIQPQANRDKVITRLALSARLPSIQADERSVRQIVLNLLANAVRYNEPGGQVIVSTALSESGHAILRVKDTGIGMSEKDLQTALQPFRQVDPGRGGGAGLGLPLTKALTEANHAGFAIRSRKGEGTLVEITFPLAPAEASVAGKTG